MIERVNKLNKLEKNKNKNKRIRIKIEELDELD